MLARPPDPLEVLLSANARPNGSRSLVTRQNYATIVRALVQRCRVFVPGSDSHSIVPAILERYNSSLAPFRVALAFGALQIGEHEESLKRPKRDGKRGVGAHIRRYVARAAATKEAIRKLNEARVRS